MLILGARVLATVTIVGASTLGIASNTAAEAPSHGFHTTSTSATAGIPLH